MRRVALLSLVPVLLAAAWTSPAAARAMDSAQLTDAAAALRPNTFVWTDTPAQGPVSVLISIPDQRAYVFRGDTMIAASAVSTGKDGNETPVGSFTILQKDRTHFSNKYDSAPMPYMQRLTWDGVAMHAGANPGFPASHGCIRLPAAFAKRLFEATALGATVEVTDIGYVADMGPPLSFGADDIAAMSVEDAKATADANRSARGRLDQVVATR